MEDLGRALVDLSTLDGDYGFALTAAQECTRYPESAKGLSRKVKTRLFKTSHPADIEAYLAQLKPSPIRVRIARAWTVYSFLRNDKRHYMPKERAILVQIPSRLEDVILAKDNVDDRTFCRIESDLESIFHQSMNETELWTALDKARSTYPNEGQLLNDITGCLGSLYADPSIGRSALTELPAFDYLSSDIVQRQRALVICRHMQELYGITTDSAVRAPVQIAPAIKDAVNEMWATCKSDRERTEREKIRPEPVKPAGVGF